MKGVEETSSVLHDQDKEKMYRVSCVLMKRVEKHEYVKGLVQKENV